MKLQKNDKNAFYTLMFPVLIENVIIRLFHIADSVMVGQMTDSTVAVAAIGLCTSPINLISSVSNNFFIGTTAAIAWYFGAGEKRKMRTFAWQSMGIATFVAALLTFLSTVFAKDIMYFICGNSEMLPIAASYYQINAYGFFFQIITFNITAMLRGIGVSKIPMVFNLTGGIVNVILNYFLIFGVGIFPEMRSNGAALATTLSKAVTLVFAVLVLIFKKTDLDYRLGIDKKPDYAIKTRLLPIGLTAAAEQTILQIGGILSAKIVAALPMVQIAANQIVVSVEGFAWATGSACQAASTSLFGRALGEHKHRKAQKFLSLSVKWAIGFALAEFAVFCIFGKQIAMIFTNDTALYPSIVIILVLSAFELPFINTHQTVSGALRSAGDSMAPLIAGLISLWTFRVLAGFIIITVLKMDIYTYRIALILDQLTRCAVVCTFYLTGHWKKLVYKKRG